MQPGGDNYWQGDQEDGSLPPASPSAPPGAPPENSAEAASPVEENLSTEFSEPVTWEASEYIHHERDTLWFISFGVVAAVLLVISVVLVQNYFFTALIIIMSIALIVYVRRPPRVLRYTLSAQGLHIGQHFYPFDGFRAFGVVEDSALYSVRFLPIARFGQALTVYFAENDGERIVDILGAYLPMEDLRLDLIDLILRRLRL